MKKYFFLLSAFLLMPLLSEASPFHAPQMGISTGFFYSHLAPYGEWIELDAGTYAWRPLRVGFGWRPYLHGRWVWTDYGWYWLSAEPFGWAVFHYGRWYYDDYYGWIWIPDDVWGPAWVEWRYGGDYIGWAPLPPYAHFSVSIGIRFTTRWVAPVHYWSFVHCRYIGAPAVTRYVVDQRSTRRLIRTSRSAGGYEVDRERIINRGVDREYIERRGQVRISRMEVAEVRDRSEERIIRDGSRERIEVFRPSRSDMERRREVQINARKPERRLSLDINRIERSDGSTGREERSTTDQGPRETGRTEPAERKQRDVAPPASRREQYLPENRPDSRVDPRREFRPPRIETRPDVKREQQDFRRERQPFPTPRLERQAQPSRPQSREAPQNQPRREDRKRGRD